MATTQKTILVEGKSLEEVIKSSKAKLTSQGFRVKGKAENELTAVRGYGIITAQQGCSMKFLPAGENAVQIIAEFYIIMFWCIKSTVAEKAVAGAIPRRKGYNLMMDFVNAVGGKVV